MINFFSFSRAEYQICQSTVGATLAVRIFGTKEQKPIAQNVIAHTASQPSPAALRRDTLIPPNSAGEGCSVCVVVLIGGQLKQKNTAKKPPLFRGGQRSALGGVPKSLLPVLSLEKVSMNTRTVGAA